MHACLMHFDVVYCINVNTDGLREVCGYGVGVGVW